MTEQVDTRTDIARIRNLAIEELAETLNFDAQERKMARQGSSLTWASFSITTLSGGEYGNFLPKGDDSMWVSDSKALPFFARESSRSGKNHLDFNAGQLALKMDALYSSNDLQSQKRFAHASKILGKLHFTVGFKETPERRLGYNLQTSVRVGRKVGNHVIFHGSGHGIIPINGPVQDIVTFGPGLSGAELYEGLFDDVKNIHYVSGGKAAHFVNEFIHLGTQAARARQDTWRRTKVVQVEPSDLSSPIPSSDDMHYPNTYFYADGIAASAEHPGLQSMLDTVVMSSVHSAGVDECVAGIEFSARRLAPGGRLIIKAPDISLGSEAGLDRIMPYAIKAFGRPAITGACGMLFQHIDPELPRRRSASFAIFCK